MTQRTFLPVKIFLGTFIVATPIFAMPSTASTVSYRDDVPALLQFAEQYEKGVSNRKNKVREVPVRLKKQNEIVIAKPEECSILSKDNEFRSEQEKDQEIEKLKKNIEALLENNKYVNKIPAIDSSAENKNKLTRLSKAVSNLDKRIILPFTGFINKISGVETKTIIFLNESLQNSMKLNKSLQEKIVLLQKDNSELLSKSLSVDETKYDSLLESYSLVEKELSEAKTALKDISQEKDNKNLEIEKLSLQIKSNASNEELSSMKNTISDIRKELSLSLAKSENSDSIIKSKDEEIAKLSTAINQYQSLLKNQEIKTSELETKISGMNNITGRTVSNDLSQPLKSALDLLIDDKTTNYVKSSYSLGTYIGQDIINLDLEHKKSGIQTDKNALLSGIVDAFGSKFKLPPSTRKSLVEKFDQTYDLANQHKTSLKEDSQDNYLSYIDKNPNMTKSEYGFRYSTLKPGSGKKITPSDNVEIYVKEMLSDGTVIQDMEKTDKSLYKTVRDLPPLFMNAVLLMKKGSRLKIVVPPELAYGTKGLEGKIPPNSVMVYEIYIK